MSLKSVRFQATKPCAGVFCILITEARETTALEMPDHDSTFVLKAADASGSAATLESESALKEVSSGASPSSGENGGNGGKGVVNTGM